MGIAAEKYEADLTGTTCSIIKIMAENPRRVAEVQITFNFPKRDFSDKVKTVLERAAHTCPVSKSLHPDLVETLVFNWA
jgi:putative redox protein